MAKSIWMPTKNNQHILEHFRGDEEFVKRMQDRIDLMQRSLRVIYTPFLSSAQQQICMQLFGKKVHYLMEGGYEQAEYQCIALAMYEEELQNIQMPIVCLSAEFPMKYGQLRHQDVLGALMNIGLKREQFGDILVQDEHIYIFVYRDVSEFVRLNCTQIARFHIQFEPFEGCLQHVSEFDYRTIMITSLRLDVLVSGITNLSRAKAQQLIRSKLVKVNHQILEDSSYLCNNNYILSIRGYGRFMLNVKNQKTKKGNIVATIGKYV